jgi:hypothetical protein
MRNNILRVLKNKWALAAIVATVVFSSAFAFAATLGVSGASLGAGNADVTSCATGSVGATYQTAYSASPRGYVVSNVVFSGLAGCGGKTLTADLTDGTNASLGQVTYSVPGTPPSSATVAAPAGVLASNLNGISVAIAG